MNHGRKRLCCFQLISSSPKCTQFCLHYGEESELLNHFPFPHEVKVLVTQLGLTLCDPVDCSPPGSSVHGILQARILAWVCHFLLQGIFPTQGSNSCLLHCRQTVYPVSHTHGTMFNVASRRRWRHCRTGLFLGQKGCSPGFSRALQWPAAAVQGSQQHPEAPSTINPLCRAASPY